jgi:hypothetical protein
MNVVGMISRQLNVARMIASKTCNNTAAAGALCVRSQS